MAITYSTAFQDSIAQLIFESVYSTLSTNQKVMIDGNWTSGTVGGFAGRVLTKLQQYGQWFDAAGAQVAQTAWDSWFVASVARWAGTSMRPDRMAMYVQLERDARNEAVESFSRKALDYNPSSDTEYASNTMQNIRFHVFSQLIRRRPPLFVAPETVDSCTNRITMNAWNGSDWSFKKRPVTMEIRTVTVGSAAYTNADKKVILTGAYANFAFVSGALLLITDSTNDLYNGRVVEIASRTSDDEIILTQALGANSTISFRTLTINFPELGTESFDSTATRMFFYQGTCDTLQWCDATEMAQARASMTTGFFGRPSRARFTTNGTKRNWVLYPWPDTDYTLTGDVYVAGPGSPASASDTTPFARFPAEFAPVLRDMVLAEVLYTVNAADGVEKRASALADLNTRLVKYAATGDMESADQSVRDVYGDVKNQRPVSFFSWGANSIGGAM